MVAADNTAGAADNMVAAAADYTSAVVMGYRSVVVQEEFVDAYVPPSAEQNQQRLGKQLRSDCMLDLS